MDFPSTSVSAFRSITSVEEVRSAAGEIREESWDDLEQLLEDNFTEIYRKLPRLEKSIWGKAILMEENVRTAKAYVRSSIITVNGSSTEFDGRVIGLSHFENALRKDAAYDAFEDLAKGIKLKFDRYKNVWIFRVSRAPVYVSRLTDRRDMPDLLVMRNRPVKLFDMSQFREAVVNQLHSTSPDRETLEKQTILCLKFVYKHKTDNLLLTPCWLMLFHLPAIELLDAILPRRDDATERELSIAGTDYFATPRRSIDIGIPPRFKLKDESEKKSAKKIQQNPQKASKDRDTSRNQQHLMEIEQQIQQRRQQRLLEQQQRQLQLERQMIEERLLWQRQQKEHLRHLNHQTRPAMKIIKRASSRSISFRNSSSRRHRVSASATKPNPTKLQGIQRQLPLTPTPPSTPIPITQNSKFFVTGGHLQQSRKTSAVPGLSSNKLSNRMFQAKNKASNAAGEDENSSPTFAQPDLKTPRLLCRTKSTNKQRRNSKEYNASKNLNHSQYEGGLLRIDNNFVCVDQNTFSKGRSRSSQVGPARQFESSLRERDRNADIAEDEEEDLPLMSPYGHESSDAAMTTPTQLPTPTPAVPPRYPSTSTASRRLNTITSNNSNTKAGALATSSVGMATKTPPAAKKSINQPRDVYDDSDCEVAMATKTPPAAKKSISPPRGAYDDSDRESLERNWFCASRRVAPFRMTANSSVRMQASSQLQQARQDHRDGIPPQASQQQLCGTATINGGPNFLLSTEGLNKSNQGLAKRLAMTSETFLH